MYLKLHRYGVFTDKGTVNRTIFIAITRFQYHGGYNYTGMPEGLKRKDFSFECAWYTEELLIKLSDQINEYLGISVAYVHDGVINLDGAIYPKIFAEMPETTSMDHPMSHYYQSEQEMIVIEPKREDNWQLV